MATIRLRGRTYRAEVCRYGVRRSSTFRSYDEARVWAEREDGALLSELAPHRIGPTPPQPHDAAAVTLPAGLFQTAAEILEAPRFRPSCGVYFLIASDEIVYVGQSLDVHSRVQQHRRCGKEFDSYTYIACEPGQLADLERHYIQALRPSLNIAGAPLG